MDERQKKLLERMRAAGIDPLEAMRAEAAGRAAAREAPRELDRVASELAEANLESDEEMAGGEILESLQESSPNE